MNTLSKQRTLAMMTGFERYTKKTRRAIFLEEMEQVVPWAKLCGLIKPHYPKLGNGRRPKELEQMLRIYFLQKFRHLLEEHNLGEEILGTVNLHLQAKGVRITTGTIVDATLIHAPSSTKNQEQSRDPEMHQTRKGKQWYFGMKAHVGVDSKTKLIHTAVATAAHVSEVAILPDLLHGEETRVWGDGAYQGQTEVIRECAPQARDFTQRRCRHKGQIVDEVAWAKNRTKSKVRAKVEHVFQVMKLKFGFVKVRYRGLKKNAHRLFVTCALVNLFVSRRKLLLAV